VLLAFEFLKATSFIFLGEVGNYWESIGPPSEKIYIVQTNEEINKRCILMTTDPGDLVLDPTCGSGTTAFVAEQWGPRWITCDTSRVALALARTRLMSSMFPYYTLADSFEGIKIESETTGKIITEIKTAEDIKKGFVNKRVSHIKLGSIANNPDLKKGMIRKQIDEAIARHSDKEILYDQPYEDKKRLRVCGPFSVESLSPHRMLSKADGNDSSPLTEQEARKQQDFVMMILGNLKKAGVENSHKNERLLFEWLDPYPGKWLHGSGEYKDHEGKIRRVAISIGPEYGTVGPQHVKEAAKEAVQGLGLMSLLFADSLAILM
jgi:adenine-specific DNA-methyltransferase